MADARFFVPLGPFALSDLAAVAGATLSGGDPARPIRDIAALEDATGEQVSFLDNPRYRETAARTRAAACLVRPGEADRLPPAVARLLTDDPYRAYALIAARFYPTAAAPCADHPPDAEIAPGAHIHATASVGPGCRIAAGVVIEGGAEIGPRCQLEANAVIGAFVRLGADSIVGPGATLSHCRVGARVVIHAGARIGQDGFGFALGDAGALKVPQVGGVVIEDDVEIGANTTIDRGSSGDTTIGHGCKIDNLVMIAHNVRLGPHCVVVAQCGVSGSTQIGAGSILAARVGIAGHLKLGAGVRLAARSSVVRDLPGHDTYGGFPAMPIRQWHRQTVAIGRLSKKRGSE